jgi:heme oxygenase
VAVEESLESRPVTVRLRSETLDLHASVEAALAYLDETLDPARYLPLLERWYGFLVVLEPRLDAWHARDGLLDWPPRRKLALLSTDLRVLGVRSRGRRELPRCPDVPTVESSAQALGALYVVEGATLGGRLLAERLQQAPLPVDALHFFSSYGPDLGRRWHRWRAATTAWVADDTGRADAVVATARETFQVLARWLAPVEGAS